MPSPRARTAAIPACRIPSQPRFRLLIGWSGSLLLGAALAQTTPPPSIAAQSVSAQSVSAQSAPVVQAPVAPAAAPGTAVTLSLADALAALPTSAQYKQAQLALQAAQVQLQAAQAATGLTAGVNTNLGAEGGTAQATTTQSMTTLSGSVGASLSLPLLPWSGASLALQSASRAYAVARVTFAQATLTLTVGTEQAYGRAVTAGLNLEIAQSQLALAQRQLAQTQAFFADNNAALPAVQSAQAAVQDAQTALLRAQAEQGSARRALGLLVGQGVSSAALNPDLSASVTALAALPTQDAALGAARRFSPALQGAQAAVQSAQTALDTARRSRDLPTTSLSASYGTGSGTSRSGLSAGLNVNSGVGSVAYSQPFTLGSSVSTGTATGTATGTGTGTATVSSSASFALGLSASFNILDPAADGTLRTAGLQVQQARAALGIQAQGLDQSLLDAHSAAQIAGQAIAARQTAVTAYTTALKTAQTRLSVGLATQTDVLNAQIALAQAQRDLNSAQLAALVSAAQLAALTGPLPGP